jgi:hypothetical protein
MQASDWLSKQLVDLQMKVETSQEKLVRYQKEHEIFGIDEKQNIITQKLDELSKELTSADVQKLFIRLHTQSAALVRAEGDDRGGVQRPAFQVGSDARQLNFALSARRAVLVSRHAPG